MCEVVSKRLEINNIKNEFIIGDLPQTKRLKIMDSFKSGKIKCLIATDVAARGIDVNDLQMVVNFDLPNEAENYVHRIGRTARAGKSGKAYTFCSEQDVYSLLPIERYIEKQIPSKVATEEDYGQDKSQGVYIRLGSEKGNKKTSKERSKQNYKTKNRSKNTKKTNSSRPKRSSSEELERLSSLTADERMKYYKEKYAKQFGVEITQNTQKKEKNSLLGKLKNIFTGRK
jgi:ATP-dependent RNA helicase RhlB